MPVVPVPVYPVEPYVGEVELGDEEEPADVATLGSADVLALEAVVPVELVDP